MITVYQIQFSDEEIRVANTQGFHASPRVSAWSEMLLSGHNNWKDEYAQYYTPVMEIDADDLEEAFNVSNGYGTASSRKLSRCRSGSVGDIFVMDDCCYIVDSVGFTAIGKYDLGSNKSA